MESECQRAVAEGACLMVFLLEEKRILAVESSEGEQDLRTRVGENTSGTDPLPGGWPRTARAVRVVGRSDVDDTYRPDVPTARETPGSPLRIHEGRLAGSRGDNEPAETSKDWGPPGRHDLNFQTRD